MAEQRSVLIIDDEPLVRQSLAAFLEDSGFRVAEASDGEEGIATFMREKPDVVLTDMRMPKVDGLGVVSALHTLSPRTPVIALSGIGDTADEAIKRGAALSVSKPIFDIEELVQAIEGLLARR